LSSSDAEGLQGFFDRALSPYSLTINRRRANMKARDDNARQNESIREQLKTYHDEIKRCRLPVGETSSQEDKIASQTDSLVAFRFLKSVSIPESWRLTLQSELLLIHSSNEFQDAYELYARLPFFWFWGQKAFILSTSLRRMRTFWPNVQVLNGSLSFCNLVPVESEIVEACKRGDIIAVRDLFQEHKASPNDVSVDDKSLLWVCSQIDRNAECKLTHLVRHRKRIYSACSLPY
jgi:hypothetical protein